jgi:hypothetical protein
MLKALERQKKREEKNIVACMLNHYIVEFESRLVGAVDAVLDTIWRMAIDAAGM